MCARLGITHLRGRNPLTGLNLLQLNTGVRISAGYGSRNPLTGLNLLQREGAYGEAFRHQWGVAIPLRG